MGTIMQEISLKEKNYMNEIQKMGPTSNFNNLEMDMFKKM